MKTQYLKLSIASLAIGIFIGSFQNCARDLESSQAGLNSLSSDTQVPLVNIDSPTSGQTLTSTFAANVSASDNAGISLVEFFVDDVKRGELASAPFSFSIDSTTLSNGSHKLNAKATDLNGNTSQSADVMVTIQNVIDTAIPTATLTAPTSGATVQGNVTLSATATDDVGVVGVQFFVDNSPVGAEDLTSPYSISWISTTVANGSHTIKARARDAAGKTGDSTNITVTVNNPDVVSPSVSVTSPAGGATISGTVTVSASASDNVGVTKVRFYLDGVFLVEDTTAPYSVSWDTTAGSTPSTPSYPNGNYAITAEAFDAANNSTLSTAVNVTVSNN